MWEGDAGALTLANSLLEPPTRLRLFGSRLVVSEELARARLAERMVPAEHAWLRGVLE